MKKIVIIIGAVIIIALTLVIFLKEEPSTMQVTTFKKSYNYLSEYDESDTLNIDIFFSIKDSYYINIENIDRATILNNQGDFIAITPTDITFQYQTSIKDKTYYMYQFQFIINFKTDSNQEINYSQAFLELDYVDDLVINIDIGSFSLNKVDVIYQSLGISISNLSGIVNVVEGLKTLVGIVVTLTNTTKLELKVTDIDILDANYQSSFSEMTTIDQFNNHDSLDILLDYHYDYFNNIDTKRELTIPGDASVKILIPLKINPDICLNKTGLKINFSKGENEYNMYYDSFTFFSPQKYLETEINALKYYHYEFN